ncbi:hypothetical protein HZC08_01865, partial [Candidatus Micrarchaeota archaeon]|nr:hypothetical protein [Candidatus Micrarchaeota archaeon]
MFVFDPFVLLFWVFISSFIPGSLLSLGLFSDSKFKLIEKVLLGFSIGLIIPPTLLLFANLLGIKFSFGLAIGSVVLFYLIGAAVFLKRNGYDSIKNIPQSLTPALFKDQERTTSLLITFFLALIVVLAFWIRLQSYSPIFQELDPYYYTYSSYQILSLGEPPFDDKTAWYPDVSVSHRTVPVLTYLESLWYSFYT